MEGGGEGRERELDRATVDQKDEDGDVAIPNLRSSLMTTLEGSTSLIQGPLSFSPEKEEREPCEKSCILKLG